MRDIVRSLIARNHLQILPETKELHGLRIETDRRFGLHVVTSPRFICRMDVAGASGARSEVQIFVKHRPNVSDEYKNMLHLWNAHYAPSRKYHIPQPLYVDDEHALLFMEYWPGETLLTLLYQSLVRSRRARNAVLESYIHNAARWLVDFQGIYTSADQKSLPQEMLEFETRLAGIPSLQAATRRRISDKMRGLISGMPLMPDTYVHDQYLFRNILKRTDEVCVVDFPHFRIGWPLYDFFTFYTGVERLEQYPFIPGKTCAWMKKAFAEAYFSSNSVRLDMAVVDNLWALFIAAYIQKRYKYKTLGGLRGAMNNMFVERMFRKLAKWSMS